MLVQQILGSKTSQEMFWVKPSSSVADAAKVMSDNRIGTVVVSSDGAALTGILSERDIVREIGKRGPECLSDTVETMMTSKITTCTTRDNADSVLSMMTEGRFRHLPVMDGDAMIGLISIGDVVKARLSELSMEKDALEGMIKGY
ncbi:CBS domain-containing protein [Loktanella sp. DSM 29012]|uniref:CBS domain-containing protein n=1 Tax=Loktanella gaetbuli TaxID=2881335 RepID=A0ABS8BRD2_9RHOB|nr:MULTISPECIES: CBS domain-containing protein [Loktanella]MCB5198283.1 CBS domain-containing protein [Loktanella gaetbuli]SEQ69503.1 CBS domain-containing protein [Loktanella sp. DSM 29012]